MTIFTRIKMYKAANKKSDQMKKKLNQKAAKETYGEFFQHILL